MLCRHFDPLSVACSTISDAGQLANSFDHVQCGPTGAQRAKSARSLRISSSGSAECGYCGSREAPKQADGSDEAIQTVSVQRPSSPRLSR